MQDRDFVSPWPLHFGRNREKERDDDDDDSDDDNKGNTNQSMTSSWLRSPNSHIFVQETQ